MEGIERIHDMKPVPGDHYAHPVEWCHPVYPPELKQAHIRGEYAVRFLVDEKGAITALEGFRGDERFKEAALAAMAHWKFIPQIADGVAKVTSYQLTFTFNPGAVLRDPKISPMPYRLDSPELIAPEELRTPDPVYPEYLGHRHLYGEVEMNLAVDEKGKVRGVEILRATHPGFITASLAALEGWEFQPAHSGRLPLPGKKNAVLSFVVKDIDTDAELKKDWMDRSDIVLRMPNPPKTADYFTAPPHPLVLADPVFPWELRQKGITGTARVNFSIDPDGRIVDATVAEASEPEFGQALLAAVTAWVFDPLYHDGEKVQADFAITWEFGAPAQGSPEERLLGLRAKGVEPISAKQLDHLPAVLFRRHPTYPAALLASGSAGDATIEFVIDHNGQACLPRIVKASAPEFGWAAATAMTQWYFETPRKGGQPADVLLQMPMEFKPD